MSSVFVADAYGNVIEPGDFINYPCRKGSRLYSRTARVLGVRERITRLNVPETVLDVMEVIDESPIRIRRVTFKKPSIATVLPKSYLTGNSFVYGRLFQATAQECRIRKDSKA